MKRARLLLADDHPMVLEGVARLLEDEFDVVGKVEDGRALVAAAQEIRPPTRQDSARRVALPCDRILNPSEHACRSTRSTPKT